jgi:hypothetical protein
MVMMPWLKQICSMQALAASVAMPPVVKRVQLL